MCSGKVLDVSRSLFAFCQIWNVHVFSSSSISLFLSLFKIHMQIISFHGRHLDLINGCVRCRVQLSLWLWTLKHSNGLESLLMLLVTSVCCGNGLFEFKTSHKKRAHELKSLIGLNKKEMLYEYIPQLKGQIAVFCPASINILRKKHLVLWGRNESTRFHSKQIFVFFLFLCFLLSITCLCFHSFRTHTLILITDKPTVHYIDRVLFSLWLVLHSFW